MNEKINSYSEQSFQDEFVRELTKYKWLAPEHLNGNIVNLGVEDLIENWRRHLNRLNASQLEGVPLTDNEFQQVMQRVNQLNNSYETAKLLSAESNIGKIDGIFRDKNPKLSREQITLTIFKKAEISGGDSVYEIAREVKSSKNDVTGRSNRFDLVLLINGLPLINIELKRSDKSLDEAFGQFKRYYKNGEYTNNFMAFSQMMVMSTPIDTRYFATPKSIDDFNKSFVFSWANKNNRRISDWQEIIKEFLRIPMAHQMIGDYLVIDESSDVENRRHMLLRPYQVYAIQAIEGAAFGRDNEDEKPHGGFIWHTTGSGKTITSFKAALLLSTRTSFEKVIFLVDRRDLDSKTTDNFKGYAKYEGIDIDDTSHTYVLKRNIKGNASSIIVTTTFKLSNLVKELEEKKDYSLKEKKFIFIIDEAHRTTMGQMMGQIKEYFKNNSIFFGFTGTPLFEENKAKGMVNSKSELINTTEKLFGPLLHQYTIDEAIKDGNVLGFHVDFINTGEFKSYDDLREKLIKLYSEENPKAKIKEIEREIFSYDDLKIEELAIANNLYYIVDQSHIPRVVEEILDNWDLQSQDRFFNAILTVAFKDRVVAYYKEFKKQLEERNERLNIAITFSYGNENDPDNNAPEIMEEMFEDYAKFTGIRYHFGHASGNEDDYFEDLLSRSTRGGSCRNPKNIDLIIVADQLLTGYDSKRLNTLYVDRDLELQSLIQAYSRTNRIFGPQKEFGTIVNFRFPQKTEASVIRALKLYGSGGNNSLVIVDKYDVAVGKFNSYIQDLRVILAEPSDWAELEHDTPRKEAFIKQFKIAAGQIRRIKQYYQYKWDDESFGIDEYSWLKYVGAYKNLRGEDIDWPDLPPDNIVGRTKLSGRKVFDSKSIVELIGEKTYNVDGHQYVDDESLKIIYEQITELSNMGKHKEAEQLKDFVQTELITGKLPSSISFDEAFANWKANKQREKILEYSTDWGIDDALVKDSVDYYDYMKPNNIPLIDEIVGGADFEKARNKSAGNQLSHVIKLTEDLKKFIPDVKKNY